MFAVTFVIFGRKTDGSEIELFRWCRDEQSGIARAQREAREFGLELTKIWAVPA
jgi:hypothetical protein